MRKLAIAISALAIALASSNVLARGLGGLIVTYSGTDTNNSSDAGVRFGGSSNVSSESHSSTYGPGYSVNYGGASSHQYSAGTASTGQPNSYNAAIELRNTTQTYSYSKNFESGHGYSNNKANSGSSGRLGGEADSETFTWEVQALFGIIPISYSQDTLAHAHSSACGHLSASSDSHSATGDVPRRRGPGDGQVGNISWGDASASLNGHAATNPTDASVLSNADVWSDSGSISERLWGRGHVHGDGDAEASVRLEQSGFAGDNPCNGCGGPGGNDKPGHGYGDNNHGHGGPPGQN